MAVARSLSYFCCDVRIDALTLELASDAIIEMALSGTGHSVHLCSAHNLALASRNPEYARVLNRSDLNLPDGTPLVLIARWNGMSGITQAQRPRGADVLSRTIDQGQRAGLRHVLYGSDPETLVSLSRRLQESFPGANIVASESPPFRPLSPAETAETVARLVEERPNVVWVALNTPEQDYFIEEVRSQIGATFVAVGAAFDFVAGTKAQAPRWMQLCGLEWLFRFVKEPGRLWKRYMWGNLVFLRGLARGVRPLECGRIGQSAGSNRTSR